MSLLLEFHDHSPRDNIAVSAGGGQGPTEWRLMYVYPAGLTNVLSMCVNVPLCLPRQARARHAGQSEGVRVKRDKQTVTEQARD